MTKQRRKSLSIDVDVAAMLSKVDNQSRYISQLIRDAWVCWRDAISILRRFGWTRNDLMATIHTMSPMKAGCTPPYGQGTQMARNTTRAWAAYVKPSRLEQLAAHVTRNADVACAAQTVVCEYWAGNELLADMIDRFDDPRFAEVAELTQSDSES